MQLAGEGDHGAGAPAVAVENDVGVPFLPRGEIRSGPGAEQIHDQRVRVVEATILECFDVNGVGIGLTQISRDLHGRVYGIIVADVATEKADDDRARASDGPTDRDSAAADSASTTFEPGSLAHAESIGYRNKRTTVARLKSRTS